MTVFVSKGSPEFRWEIGKILARQRKHLKLYQTDVAKIAGVGVSTIYKYESGSVTPGLSVMIRLVHCLQLDWAEIMGCLKYDYKEKQCSPKTKFAI